EVLSRWERLRVVAVPLARCAVILALVPVAGAWFVSRPAGSGSLFLGAAFLGVQAYRERRRGLAVAALLLANLGLHPLLMWGGLRHLTRPELFFGPFGLSLVAAAHLAGDRLRPAQREAIGVAGTVLVLASLTFAVYVDLTLRITESVALAVLAVAGALLGMRLRIRSYVYTGGAFLLLDVASHVYWVGRVHVWLWWASLVTLGVLVVAVFAVLERRRSAAEASADCAVVSSTRRS
ncbi:hypothetical protein ACFL59_08340, partial [Planctomycetota bacterium]